MKTHIIRHTSLLIVVLCLLLIAACTNSSNTSPNPEGTPDNIVNLYTDRHYEADKQLYDKFTKQTGIQVNVVSGKSDELLERLVREGKDTQADVFITADAGRLHVAKEKKMLASIESDMLTKLIPENLRDPDNQWFGLTVRARVIVYAKDRVNPADLSTYEDLATPKWKGKVLIRPSSNIYNQSLLASFIALYGEDKSKQWANGIVSNMARDPKGNDRDQATSVAAGTGDVAIMNTYYIGLMLNSSNPEEVQVAQKLGIFFPNQNSTGTHINISGAGVTKYAKHSKQAVQLIEFLSSDDAQKTFAETNYEYPANPQVQASALLQSWGSFKRQDLNLAKLGEYNAKAVMIMNEVNWK